MIGKKIKKYRGKFNLTGTTLAKLAGINQPYLSEIENEKKVPTFDTFMRIIKALASNGIITDENANTILTKDVFNNFSNKITDYKIKKIKGDITHKELMLRWDGGKDWYCSKIEPNISFQKLLVNTFYKGHINPPKGSEFIINFMYSFSEIQTPLALWWYDYILKDFIYEDKIEIDSPTYNQENELLLSVRSLENNNGVFTPIETDNSINLSKELLDGKTVTVDLRSTNDKNIRLLLDGQLLSNDELTAIKYTLNGIRYNRQHNEQNSYFGRKRQKLIDEGYFDNDDSNKIVF